MKKKTDAFQITLQFGGGQNSSASESGIDPRECSTGQNFEIDFKNFNLRNRKPFDKMGTAPNGGSIKGFVNHIASNGTITMLVQAGDKVYKWSKSGGFIYIGACSASAKLRGPTTHYWSLDDLTIVTDLSLVQPVMVWDGGSLTTMTHNLGGDFYAKYCLVDDERARFANVISSSTATPHLIATSKLSDYTNLSVSNRPSSSLGADDPYYVLTPDLRAVNGMTSAFSVITVSSQYGSLYQIVGTDSKDTQIDKLYSRSGAAGNESMEFVGNDIIYGKIGRIESVISTLSFGDVLSNDLSYPISDAIDSVTSWDIIPNPRTQKIYCHPVGQNYIWVINKTLIDRKQSHPLTQSPVSSLSHETPLSPWSKYVTSHSSMFNPTAMMCCIDPDDGIEYVYFGDSAGNLYRMEGTGDSGDGGSSNIIMTWRSSLFEIPGGLKGNSFDGYVSYRSASNVTITVKLLFAGSQVTDESSTITLKGTPGQLFWGGASYWGGSNYWGVPFQGRFRREAFTPTGSSEQFQVEVSYTGSSDIEINEIGLAFGGS